MQPITFTGPCIALIGSSAPWEQWRNAGRAHVHTRTLEPYDYSALPLIVHVTEKFCLRFCAHYCVLPRLCACMRAYISVCT